MHYHNKASLKHYDPLRGILTYETQAPPDYLVAKQGFETADIAFWDGRRRSPEQNEKAHAIINDIAEKFGYLPSEAKVWLKYQYISLHGSEWFSMHNVDMTTARLFIEFLIDFAFEWDVPLRDTDFARNGDTDAYLYACIMRKKCVVCFDLAELHHAEDRVGMGRNRKTIIHEGMRVMALCRKCHSKAHRIGQKTFNEKYHVYGIEATEDICKVYNLNKK